jgi:hypothetical protein
MKINLKKICFVGIGCLVFFGLNINGNAAVIYDGLSFCWYSISPETMTFSSSGGRKAVTITASGSSFCEWTATESLDWISLSSTEGVGSATLTVQAAANTGKARSGTVSIAGIALSVSQEAGAFPGRFNPAILPLLLDE